MFYYYQEISSQINFHIAYRPTACCLVTEDVVLLTAINDCKRKLYHELYDILIMLVTLWKKHWNSGKTEIEKSSWWKTNYVKSDAWRYEPTP